MMAELSWVGPCTHRNRHMPTHPYTLASYISSALFTWVTFRDTHQTEDQLIGDSLCKWGQKNKMSPIGKKTLYPKMHGNVCVCVCLLLPLLISHQLSQYGRILLVLNAFFIRAWTLHIAMVCLCICMCGDQALTDHFCCEDIFTCEDILAGPHKHNATMSSFGPNECSVSRFLLR